MVMGMPWSCCWAWGGHADGHAMRMLMGVWWAWACDGHAHGPPTCLTPHRLPPLGASRWDPPMGPLSGACRLDVAMGLSLGGPPRWLSPGSPSGTPLGRLSPLPPVAP